MRWASRLLKRAAAAVMTIAMVSVLVTPPAAGAYTIGVNETPVITSATTGDGRVELTWTDGEIAAAYWVYRNHELVGIVGDDEPLETTWADKHAPNGESLVYQVAAYRRDGTVDTSAGHPAIAAPGHGFTDVPTALDEAVRWLRFGDGTAPFDPGYPDGRFRPARAVTRGQLVAMLYGMAGRPAPSQFPRIHVTDVPVELKAAARWAVADPDGSGPGAPVAKIQADHTFRPTAPLDRGAAAQMLFRFAGSPAGFPPSGFADVPARLRPAVNFLVGIGVMSGYPDHTFGPTRPFPRGDTALVLHRYTLAFTMALFAYLQPPDPGTDWQPPDVFSPGENGWYTDRPAGIGSGQPARRTFFTRSNSRWHRPDVLAEGLRVWTDVGGSALLLLVPPPGMDRLVPGLYSENTSNPWSGPPIDHADADVRWAGCESGRSWYAVDDIAYGTDGRIDRLAVRYGLLCTGQLVGKTILGAVHYDVTNPTDPDAPLAIPQDLWSPPTGSVPADGENFLFVTSAPGDWIGQGHTRLFLQDDAHLDPALDDNGVDVAMYGFDSIDPSVLESWHLVAQPPDGYEHLEEGFYPDIERVPFQNPARGGLSLDSEAHGCSGSMSWLAVDDVAYQPDGSFARLDLRFEHRCTDRNPLDPPLRGAFHYDVDHDRPPINPQPIPAYWQPSTAMPTTGNFLFLDSQAGEPLLSGQDLLSAPPDYTFRTDIPGRTIEVEGSTSSRFVVQPPWEDDRLAPGYYEGVAGVPTTRGTLRVDVGSLGCSAPWIRGDFVVDDVAYAPDGTLQRLYLRFRQSCSGSPYLRGKLHYDAPA